MTPAPLTRSNARIALALAGVLALSSAPVAAQGMHDYDLVVYGGTAGGIASAVQAARMGKRVALIEPGQHLGGMSSGGLSFTDTYWPSAVGGIASDFYRRAGRAYGKVGAEYRFEPKVAEQIFESMVVENSIDVFRGERLDLSAGVTKTGTTIHSITMESGRSFSGAIFIDATYEGDLMAKAGASYAVGRESNATYGEKYNGVQRNSAWSHQFGTRVDPYVIPGDPNSGLLYGISSEPPGAEGTGDHRIQAYNYRLTFTTDPARKLPWTRPANYDASKYELLARYIRVHNITQVSGKLLKITASPIQAGKYDVNNEGGFSTDFIGGNYDYPEGDYATRERIIQEHQDYQKGLLYFLATDPRLPESIRQEMNSYGLAADEFTDNGGWPHQLYVREARRLVGEYVMTDNNVIFKDGQRVAVDDPVGLGTYTMDSHHTQRYVIVDAQGAYVRNEGDVQVGITQPYGISYRSLTPQRQEVSNLIVPVALSASHIAYGSMRMEPTFMILGQTAGTAAVQAMDEGLPVQQVDYQRLSQRLIEDGQVLTWGAQPAPGPLVGTLVENFNYGPAANRIDLPSTTTGGWAEPWGPGIDYLSNKVALDVAPNYGTGFQLTYDAPGYVNAQPSGQLISGGAGADSTGPTYAAVVSGRGIRGGMEGTIWISALARLDGTDEGQDVLLWLDRTAAGNGVNAGDAFIGLRKSGYIQLRHSGNVNLFEASDTTYAAGEVHLLLARLVLNADGTADELSFWINPNLHDLGAPNLFASGGDFFGDTLEGIGLSLGSAGGAIDAIRISNAPDGFLAVTGVPEPAGTGVLALASIVLTRRRRKS